MKQQDKRKRGTTALNGDNEGAAGGDVAVGHAGRVESEGGIAVAVEENEATGGVSAFGEVMDRIARGEIGARNIAGRPGGRVNTSRGAAKKIDGCFGHNDFHDGFAVAGARNAASFGIGVTTAADKRRIAYSAGKFAAGTAGGSGREKAAVAVHGYGADGSLLVAPMMFGGVFVPLAVQPGFAFGRADKIFRSAERNAVLFGETFGAFGDKHHVRRIFQDSASQANGVSNALQCRDGAGTERGAIHDDGVAFDAAIEIEVRAESGVEDGIVFQHNDGSFDRVKRGAAPGEKRPSRGESAATAGVTGFDGLIGNIPGTAMNDQRRFHRSPRGKQREAAMMRQMKKSSKKRSPPMKNRMAAGLMPWLGMRLGECRNWEEMTLRRDSSRGL
jgi:hypothetical protein